MQIHELDTYISTPSDTDYMAVDDGTETFKIPMTSVGTTAISVSLGAFSLLPQVVTNTNITEDMVVMKAELSNPTAQVANWTVTTVAGSATIAGSINGTTSMTLYLIKCR